MAVMACAAPLRREHLCATARGAGADGAAECLGQAYSIPMPLSSSRPWPASLLRPWSLQQRALLVALLSSLPLMAVLVMDAIDHQDSRRESLRQHAAAVLQTAAREQAQELLKVRTLLETAERIPGVVGTPAARCLDVLPRLLPANHPYQTLSRTDTKGRIDCATRAAAVGIRVDTLASFQRPRRTNRFDIGDYQRSRAGNIAVIVAAFPVRDVTGQFQHMLAVSLRLDSLLARLHVGTLPPGTKLELRDQSGRHLVDRVVPGAPAPPVTDTAALPAILREEPTLQMGPQDFWEYRTPEGTWTLWTRIQTDPERAAAWLVAHVPATYLTTALRDDALWRLALGIGVMAVLGLVAWSAARRWVGQEVEALVRLASLVRDEQVLPETATRLPDLAPVEAQLREVSRMQRERKQMSQQLRQTERLDSLGAVVGSVAHDFHNALGVMLTAAEVAEDEVPPHSSAADQLRLIRQAVERSAHITQQLLAFTRRTPGEAQTAKLRQVLEPMRDVLPRVLGKPHQLVWEIPDEAIWVHLDGVELEQALMNLVSNARAAFAPQQSGKVTIRAHVPRPSAALDVGLDMSTPWCVIEVEDTGSGIPPEHLARICEPFFSTKQ